MADGPVSESGTLLSSLLSTLGPLLLSPHGPVTGISSTDPSVRASIVWDPMEPVPPVAGGVLLMTGASLVPGRTAAAMKEAEASDYAAVVLKPRDLVDGIVNPPLAGNLRVLLAPDDASWNSLHALITAAVSGQNTDQSASIADLAPGDLFSLANAIAAVAGTAITIENVSREVVAYSNVAGQATDESRRDAILGRVVPDLPWYLARYRAVAMAIEPVFFGQENGALERVAMPIRVGPRLVGSLWAFADGARPGDEIAKVLADAAPIVSLHLLHAAGAYSLQRHRRGELLTAALGGVEMEPGAVLTLAAQMPVILVGFADLDGSGADIDLGRIADIIALNAEAVRRTASCTVLQDRVYVLFPGADHLSEERIRNFLATSKRAVSSAARVDLRSAYSGPVKDLSDVDQAHKDIETAFRYLSGEPGIDSLCVDDQRHRVLLQELAEGSVAVPARLLGSVRDILDFDAQHGTNYALTLLTHLEMFGDNRRAAELMMVHENSQRYRMRQLSKRFGIDLGDPELRLVIWLQLRLSQRANG